MIERETKLEVFQIDPLCSKCGREMIIQIDNFRESLTESILMLPPQEYLYKCEYCGKMEGSSAKYPKIIYRKVEES